MIDRRRRRGPGARLPLWYQRCMPDPSPTPAPAGDPVRRRALLLAGAAPWLARHSRAADLPRFELGVASGHPRPDGMVLWTRLTGPDLPARVEVQWEVGGDEAMRQVMARGSQWAQAEWAHSVHAEPAGLAAGRPYWYRFRALGQQSATGRTRTAPAPDAESTLRLVLASCQRWDHGHWAAWRHAVSTDPELVLFVGDYIYEYPSPPFALRRHEGGMARTLAQYRRRHEQYRSDPALQAAHAAAPWIMVWDDHEIENDYAGDRSPTLDGADFQAVRSAAAQAYWEHLPLPLAVRPQQGVMRMHGRLDWGRLARLHWLDDRQYRDLQACPPPLRLAGSAIVDPQRCPSIADPGRSLLGEDQERWLAEGWDLERRWNLLAQQTLLSPLRTAEGRVWTDGWDGYPAARLRLLQAVAQRQVPGVVVLGGDRHAHFVSDVHERPEDARSPRLASEFCGTSISSLGPRQDRLDAALAHNPHLLHARGDRRGFVALELGRDRLQARLMAVDNALDPASTMHEQARFIVDPRRPGPQRA